MARLTSPSLLPFLLALVPPAHADAAAEAAAAPHEVERDGKGVARFDDAAAVPLATFRAEVSRFDSIRFNSIPFHSEPA